MMRLFRRLVGAVGILALCVGGALAQPVNSPAQLTTIYQDMGIGPLTISAQGGAISFIVSDGQPGGAARGALLYPGEAPVSITQTTHVWAKLAVANTGAEAVLAAIGATPNPPTTCGGMTIAQGGTGACDPTTALGALGGLGFVAPLVPGDVLIADPSGTKAIDSGFVPKLYTQTATSPTVNDDVTQHHAIGDLWMNTATGIWYTAFTVAQGAAVWTPNTPGALITRWNWSWVVTTLTPSANPWYSSGSFIAGTTLNYQDIAASQMTFSDLNFTVSANPGMNGSTPYVETITLFTGVSRFETASTIFCTITGSSVAGPGTCTPTNPATQVIVPPQYGYTLQIIIPVGATTPGTATASLSVRQQ